MQFNQMNQMNGGYQQELLNQQLQQQQALFGNKHNQLQQLQQLQQQQMLRNNPLLSNMLNMSNPGLMAQFQMQQQMQLQQLQRMLEAQKMFTKQQHQPQHQSPRLPRSAPKPRNQKPRKQQSRTSGIQKEITSDEDKPMPHRRILAINLPMSVQTIESVTGVFHPYGDVTVVRVLKPGKNLPQDVKPWLRTIPDLGRTCCAIVDFETARAAKFAVHVLRQRENEVGFRCGLLKQGVEEKLYERKDLQTTLPQDKLLSQGPHSSDSGITSEDANSSASTRSTSASEQSDHSDSEIISSHTDSEQEASHQKASLTVKYDRDFLLSFSSKNKKSPSRLPNLDHILRKENGDERENGQLASEPIRQPRGPLSGSNGFRLARH